MDAGSFWRASGESSNFAPQPEILQSPRLDWTSIRTPGKASVGMPPYHVSRLRHTPQLAVCNHKDAFQLLFLESAGQKAGQVLSSLRSWPAGSSPRLSSTRLSTKRQTFTVAVGMNGASRDDHAYSSNSDSEEVEAVVVEASVSAAVPDCSKWQSKVRVVVAGSRFLR